MRARALAWTFAICAVSSAVSLWWLAHDGQPQGPDQANHLIRSFEFSSCLRHANLRGCWSLWTAEYGVYTYPPLYHLLTGGLMLVARRPVVAAAISNLLFLSLLVYSVVQIGRRAFDLPTALLASSLLAMSPIVAQFEHEAFIDLALAGMTSWCVWRLLATDGFHNRRASIVFGASVGFALLLKFLAPLYLIGPAVALLWVHRRRYGRVFFTNLALSLVAMLVVALPWYALHWHTVLATGEFNQQVAAVEGDPMPWTLAGVLFYVQAISGAMGVQQTGFGVFLVALSATIWFALKGLSTTSTRDSQRPARLVVAMWAGVGLCLLTFVVLNKDPRYSLPILPALALVTAGPLFWIRSAVRRASFAMLLVLLAFPYYTHILFSWPTLHRDITFTTGPLAWTVWSESDYYGGAPSMDDWDIPNLLFRMHQDREPAGSGRPIRLALVPALLRLNTNSVWLEALESGIPVELRAIGNEASFIARDARPPLDFVLLKSGAQGPAYLTRDAAQIGDFIVNNPDRFKRLKTFSLPDGSAGTLFGVE